MKTPEKQSASVTSSPKTTTTTTSSPNQQLNTSHDHDTDDEANECIEDDDDDDMDRSIDGNGQMMHCKRNKKTRTVFSRAQVFQLESTFDMKKYVALIKSAAYVFLTHENRVFFLLDI